MKRKANVLIIDDDKEILLSCARTLQNNGDYNVTTISNSTQALNEIESEEFDLILCDLSMPNYSGMELLRKAKVVAPETPFVIFSGYGNVERAVQAMRDGAFDFIEKPFKKERLKVVVEKSLHHRNLHKQKRALQNQLEKRYHFDNIIGKSPSIQMVFDMISRIAEGESNVTITGESGTGKELVARSIHAHSLRKSKPFVPINCGAFPENLFESELFGYEKGAFTGAYRRKPGLVEFADGGTFFLDEICELSHALQVKLLRMLQDRKIRRVGGNELIDVDVRIISASNRNLVQALKDGYLREDLYYRLNVISIELPSLRERKEDIPLLCHNFIDKYSKLTPKRIKGISVQALKLLQEYSWPGNVRELENVIERAITLAKDEWIQPVDLPENIVCVNEDYLQAQISLPLKEARQRLVASFEQDYLIKMLERHHGNITNAAKSSGVDRRTFHRLLNRHHINSRDWK
ncbi:MAG: sigma-54-dependent transcriptional regulator [bacterium]